MFTNKVYKYIIYTNNIVCFQEVEDMSSNIKKIYYLSSTHWDREWYRPFQGFRFALVGRINEVITTLENDPSFSTFIMDGQTIVLDDYCQIEPENKERLVQLIKDQRIVVGPWYTMPDEFLVSGESLIRNLIIGHSLAEAYGSSAMKYGYICDIFGHIAQFPQILKGFNINGALLGRGTNNHNCPSHFLWESPDGSQCITFKVPEETGYATFWSEVYMDYLFGTDPDKENLIKRACAYVDKECERSNVPYIVLMDGMDHERIHELAPWIASRLSEIYDCPVVFENMENLVKELAEYTQHMPVKQGELNETAKIQSGHNMLITNTLSSRYDLKKANDECQILLENWMLPMSAVAAIKGYHIQKSYTDLAYRYLIQCQAHDSICGCSIDAVHKDMHYRYRQVECIGNEVIKASISHMVKDVKTDSSSDIRLLTIFNPLPYPRHETISVTIDFNRDFKPKFKEQASYEFKNGFKLIEEKGEETPYNLTNISYNSFSEKPGNFYRNEADLYTIAFTADLPPMGSAEYLLVPYEKPIRYLSEISTSETSCENEYIRLDINLDGTINLLDKETGNEYRQLLSYVDDGEIGDGWFHANPVSDRAVSSHGSSCMIEKVDDGPAACTFNVTNYMRVPKKVTRHIHGNCRSDDTVDLKITSRITISKANNWVDIKTSVDNTALDHRLRLKIPTGINSGKYYADQAFSFVERTTGFDRNTGEWKEPDLVEKSFESIVMKRDAAGDGLAFISAAGLHECAALDDKEGTIFITLLRSFSKTHLTDGEIDGQLQQTLEYSYRLVPVRSTNSFADMVRFKDCLQTGTRVITNRVGKTYSLVGQHGAFSLTEGNVVLSLLKRSEEKGNNSIIVRMSNYSDSYSIASYQCMCSIKQAYETNMMEENITTAVFHDNVLELELKPWEIKTYRIIL